MEAFIAIISIPAFLLLSLILFWTMQKRTIDSLRRTAAELGYEFVTGAEPAFSQNALPETEPQPGWKRVLSYFAPWRIRGREGEENVAIYTVVRGSGKSRSTYTIVEMSAHSKAGSFAISKEGFFSKVGKALFALQDIQAGDPEFDAKAMVKGQDSEAVKRLLSSSALRSAIMGALDAYPGLRIGDSKIVFERSGSITKAEFFRPLIQSMSEVARTMGEA